MLRVKSNGQNAKPRTFVVVRDIGPTHTLGVYNNNIRTVERAFQERYFLCKVGEGFEPALTVRPRAYVRNQDLQRFKHIVVKSCRNAPVVSLPHVVEAYTGPKRRIYQAAMESLGRDPLVAKDSHLTSFVKFEKQDLGKAPRVINPRSPRYNLVLGKYLKFLEKRVYKGINRAFGAHTAHTVIKGLNVVESGKVVAAKWRRFRNPVGIGLDAQKFDMHTSVPALKYEHSVYTDIFPRHEELKKILRQQLSNKGTAYCEDGQVKFKMEGTRSSGDLNTSLGNCIIMCGLVYAYAAYIGVYIELLNNGDDCVVILEGCELDEFMGPLIGWFRRYGYRMTVEKPVFELEEIEFCQSKLVMVDDEPRMVRNLTNALKKDPMCLIPIQGPSVLQQWYGAVGDCGLSITSALPVLQEYYKMYQRSGKEYSLGFLQHVQKNTAHFERMRGMTKKEGAISAATRCSFYYAFGVLPAYQIELERLFARTNLSLIVEEALHCDMSVDKFDNCPSPLVQYLF